MKTISQQTKRRALQLKGYATYKGYALRYYIVFATTNNNYLSYDIEGYSVHKTEKKTIFEPGEYWRFRETGPSPLTSGYHL